MTHNTNSPALENARNLLVNPKHGTPPAALQMTWELAKRARGQSVNWDALDHLLNAIATFDNTHQPRQNRVITELRRARHATPQTGGDAA